MYIFRRILGFLAWMLLVILLTFSSQTGGVILLVVLMLRRLLPRPKTKLRGCIRNWSIFLTLYAVINFLLVPQIAQRWNKVPLPVFSENLRPHRLAYALLNRHYVTPQMRSTLLETAAAMQKKFPGTVTYYLDSSHPLGTPRLYPHLKHKSGRKTDVCFYYQKKENPQEKVNNPGLLGYGYFAPPLPGETDLPADCAKRGSWWYGITGRFLWRGTGQDTEIDAERTTYFLQLLSRNAQVRRVFIEPHLKERFGLRQDPKIRFHGCWAVRHDDHAHVEVNH